MVRRNSPPLGVGAVELGREDLPHGGRRRVGAQGGEAIHVEVDGVVADPLHGQLDHPGGLPVLEELVGIVVGHQG
jgi:hypothetical protein